MAMTHDELLLETNRRLQIALYNGDIPALHALRAVVELHKPFGTYCEACVVGGIEYPCPTIQAIEKELE